MYAFLVFLFVLISTSVKKKKMIILDHLNLFHVKNPSQPKEQRFSNGYKVRESTVNNDLKPAHDYKKSMSAVTV